MLSCLTSADWLAARLSHVPTELGRLQQLRGLGFDYVGHGTIPTELGRMAALSSLLLAGDVNLSGAVPTELARLSLEHLQLSDAAALCGGFTLEIRGRHRVRQAFEPCPAPPPSPPAPPLPVAARLALRDDGWGSTSWATVFFLACAGCALGVSAVYIVQRLRDSQVAPAHIGLLRPRVLVHKLSAHARRVGVQHAGAVVSHQRGYNPSDEFQVLTGGAPGGAPCESSTSAEWHEHGCPPGARPAGPGERDRAFWGRELGECAPAAAWQPPGGLYHPEVVDPYADGRRAGMT